MVNKSAEKLWKAYPGSHLHCDVTLSGPDSYRVEMALLDDNGQTINNVVHYGTGELENLKDKALEKLIEALDLPVES